MKLLLTGEIAEADKVLAAVNARSQFACGGRRRSVGGRVDDRRRTTSVLHGDDDVAETTRHVHSPQSTFGRSLDDRR